MNAISRQRGFVVLQFAWVSFAFSMTVLLLADFAPCGVIESSGRAKVVNAQTGVRIIAAKSSSYNSDTAHQPESIGDLYNNARKLSGWNGPYITEQQSKDPWGHSYIIRVPGLHSALDVISLGADGLADGVGTNADIGNSPCK